MAQPSASFLRYQAYLDAKGARPQPRPHWWRLVAARRHRPARPDQLAQVWEAWVAAHGGDEAAALGALAARHIDEGGAA